MIDGTSVFANYPEADTSLGTEEAISTAVKDKWSSSAFQLHIFYGVKLSFSCRERTQGNPKPDEHIFSSGDNLILLICWAPKMSNYTF